MTTGTDALLARLHRPLTRGLQKHNSTISRPSSVKTTNASQRQYRTHIRRTCYQCRQEGHYARDCPHATTPKPTKTRMERMRLLLKSMTPTERAQFKREISPQMKKMQTHLRTMTTLELEEFKRQVISDATRTPVTTSNDRKASTNSLSRETSPRTDQTLTEAPPSRETGPHPSKSTKKLAQALRKRIRHEVERRIGAPELDHSFETLAKTLKSFAQVPRPISSMRKLTDALKRHFNQKERCEECKGEHPTHTCLKRFKRLRRPQTIPLSASDDDSSNNNAPHNSERMTNDETDLLIDLEKAMTKLSI